MVKGFSQVLVSQTLSATADNALLIIAVGLLSAIDEPAWATPLLKLVYVIGFVLFACYFGVLANAFPKGRVMFVSNLIKIAGCVLMMFSAHPLVAYSLIGLGAAFYSPAKYGILSELLPPEKLVTANSWMEGLTVVAVILGTLLGGGLISQDVRHFYSMFSWSNSLDTIHIAIGINLLVYCISEAFILGIPRTRITFSKSELNPKNVLKEFNHCVRVLFKDKLSRISLESTSAFWGIVASLQLLLLAWAEVALNMDLSQASVLLASVILGVVIGAVIASMKISLKSSIKVAPLGILMGTIVAVFSLFRGSMLPGSIDILGYSFTYGALFAAFILVVLGIIAGLFLVPMDAILQYQGDRLVSSSQSVSVQNLCEKSSVLLLMAFYSILVKAGFGPTAIMVILGIWLVIVCGIICLQAKREGISALLSK